MNQQPHPGAPGAMKGGGPGGGGPAGPAGQGMMVQYPGGPGAGSGQGPGMMNMQQHYNQHNMMNQNKMVGLLREKQGRHRFAICPILTTIFGYCIIPLHFGMPLALVFNTPCSDV